MGILTDLDGNPRFVDDPATPDTGVPGGAGGDAIVDMGAYEFPCDPCDMNCDGTVDASDIEFFIDLLFTLIDNIVVSSGCDPCDMNCDGAVDALDIEFFIDILFNNGPRCEPCTGDTNGDGEVNAEDIEGFINCLFP